MAFPSDLRRWFQRKGYQYEVTIPLYMMTPTEKFVFNSFLFIFLSMIVIAISLYLPEHIVKVITRAWFYYAGDDRAPGHPGAAHRLGQGIGHVDGMGNMRTRPSDQEVMNMLGTL